MNTKIVQFVYYRILFFSAGVLVVVIGVDRGKFDAVEIIVMVHILKLY